MAQWWSTLQKTQPQHWLTGLLASRLSSTPADKDSAPVLALLPSSCPLSPKPTGSSEQQKQLHEKMLHQEQLRLEGICGNLRSCTDSAQVCLAPDMLLLKLL